jgi:hypothetical protein
MKTETLDQWQKRTGKKPTKVDFSDAYKIKDFYRGEFIDYTKKQKLAELAKKTLPK